MPAVHAYASKCVDRKIREDVHIVLLSVLWLRTIEQM